MRRIVRHDMSARCHMVAPGAQYDPDVPRVSSRIRTKQRDTSRGRRCATGSPAIFSGSEVSNSDSIDCAPGRAGSVRRRHRKERASPDPSLIARILIAEIGAWKDGDTRRRSTALHDGELAPPHPQQSISVDITPSTRDEGDEHETPVRHLARHKEYRPAAARAVHGVKRRKEGIASSSRRETCGFRTASKRMLRQGAT